MMKSMLALMAGVAGLGAVAVTAQTAKTPAAPAAKTAVAMDRSILHVQVILDKLGFGPGILDGRPGMSLTAALKGFQESRGLPVTGEMDATTFYAAAVGAGPTMVVGDFNATRDHPTFRSILDLGLHDAADQADSGWQPTWPTGARAWYLWPVITIDHVLVSPEFTGVRTTTLDVEGTDHRALVADLDRR